MANLTEVFEAKKRAAAAAAAREKLVSAPTATSASPNKADVSAAGMPVLGIPKTPPTARKPADALELMLLIDVVPAKPDPALVTLEDLTAALRDEVARDNNVPDWRAVEYGKGRPQLAAKLRAWLNGSTGRLVVLAKSDSDVFRAVGEVLVPLAVNVFVGLR